MTDINDRLPLATEYKILLDILLAGGESDRSFARREIERLKELEKSEKLVTGQEWIDRYHAALQALSANGEITDDVISYKAWKAARVAAGLASDE
jgi:hypothetical protein